MQCCGEKKIPFGLAKKTISILIKDLGALLDPRVGCQRVLEEVLKAQGGASEAARVGTAKVLRLRQIEYQHLSIPIAKDLLTNDSVNFLHSSPPLCGAYFFIGQRCLVDAAEVLPESLSIVP